LFVLSLLIDLLNLETGIPLLLIINLDHIAGYQKAAFGRGELLEKRADDLPFN